MAQRNQDNKKRDDRTLPVLIRHNKVDPFGTGRIAITSKHTADLLKAWLAYRGPEIEWPFCSIYQGKVIDRRA